MTGFKPLTSGVRSDRSANWATTTAHHVSLLVDQFDLAKRLAICAQTTWPRKSADRKWVSIYSALESESNLKGRKKSSKNLFDLFANDPFSAYFEFEMLSCVTGGWRGRRGWRAWWGCQVLADISKIMSDKTDQARSSKQARAIRVCVCCTISNLSI